MGLTSLQLNYEKIDNSQIISSNTRWRSAYPVRDTDVNKVNIVTQAKVVLRSNSVFMNMSLRWHDTCMPALYWAFKLLQKSKRRRTQATPLHRSDD